MSDLNYQSSDWAKEQMGSRGYPRIHSDWHNNRNWTYWWSNAGNTCIKMQDDGGKVQSLETTVAMDCNQKESGDDKLGMSTGAKVAVGAAALLGVALLASSSRGASAAPAATRRATRPLRSGEMSGTRQCVQAVTKEGRIKRFEGINEGNCT